MSANTPPSLLLLPGLWCDRTIWSPQLDSLSALEVQVADYGEARSLAEMAVRALAGAPPRFALAGHSMGARVALEVFRQAPERVERLALLDTGIHPVSAGEAAKRHAQRDLGRSRGIEALIDAWLLPMLHPAHRDMPEIVEPLRAMCRRGGLAMFEAHIEALLGRTDPRDLLPTIAVPTLVGVGRQDAWSPVEQHRQIAAAIPGSILTIFEDSGHMAPVEAPQAVTAALRRWLEPEEAINREDEYEQS
ncbi:alpha/beta fold hydrolase [Sphingomonas sp. M1-B02]|uniref:alpha/beta fold hydrolase n=1 Tax=Sphingomonas sp. M1-B02 TaxID=3114300 RepID=UPI00223EE4FB|nr:alpha/beta fold hydrolase [Sphingomonas sp. S6-11]UZK65076.1 alpha/beta hydrolase [Sphingomonas sp. S6-11]